MVSGELLIASQMLDGCYGKRGRWEEGKKGSGVRQGERDEYEPQTTMHADHVQCPSLRRRRRSPNSQTFAMHPVVSDIREVAGKICLVLSEFQAEIHWLLFGP